MAWIETIEPAAATGRLAELYDLVIDPHNGQVHNIMQVHGLNPDGLAAHYQLYQAVMAGTPGLPLVDRELIALVVSQHNGCHY